MNISPHKTTDRAIFDDRTNQDRPTKFLAQPISGLGLAKSLVLGDGSDEFGVRRQPDGERSLGKTVPGRHKLAENRVAHGETQLRVARMEREGDMNLGTYAECQGFTVEGLVDRGFLKISDAAMKMLA